MYPCARAQNTLGPKVLIVDGKHQHRQRRPRSADFLDEFQARPAGERKIGHDNVRLGFLNQADGLVRRLGHAGDGHVTLHFDPRGKAFADDGVIIDQ